MNAFRRTGDDESGSLPLVLLAAIILAGVVVALATTVQTGVNTARQDRNFNAAIHVADAGIQEAYVELAAIMADLEEDEVPPDEVSGDGDVEGSPYEWVATRQTSGRYEVVARGERGSEGRGSMRTLVAEMGSQVLFPLALYADISMVFKGLPSGSAQAYDAAGNEVTADYLLGSGGDITINGKCEEGVILHGDDAEINRTCTPVPIDQDRPTLEDLALKAYEEPGGPCFGEDAIDDGDFAADANGAGLIRGKTYCISGHTFDKGESVNVVTDASFEAEKPARVYVAADGTFRLPQGSGTLINTGGVEPVMPGDAPDSTALEVYMSGGTFSMGANSHFAGVLWAPNSACEIKGTAATYGALVCRSFDSGGEWSHWYDIRAASITDGLLDILAYREDPGYEG